MAVTRAREDPDVTAQPEPDEPHRSRLIHPRLRALSWRDWRGILVRSVKGFMADNGPMLASALAYSTFFAIPATLLVVLGAFTLVVGPETITTVMRHFSTVIPGEATSLLGGSLLLFRLVADTPDDLRGLERLAARLALGKLTVRGDSAEARTGKELYRGSCTRRPGNHVSRTYRRLRSTGSRITSAA